ncbi:MAG: branched-chain amino acid ABC transporter permease [Deltaproteobacteria bacterium]|nr:branched-chain amino acid ABC transporter permease [Deltaproteobacteria bacterium]MBW2150461.1 branched-chain amino acid ABC transporter permease [Deltaproteobacteria bacterium]
MATLINILVLGAIWGAIYSLIAVGFTLIFGVAGIINLSHGAFYMLGAYLAYTFMTIFKINVWLSALMAAGGTAIIAMLIDRFGIRPTRERHVYVLIITLAFAMFFQELMYAIYGPHGKPVKSFVSGDIILGDVHVSYQKILTFFVSGALVTLLWLFIKKTRAGKSISAVAQNRDAAVYMGIQPERVYLITMGISAALAAVAGVFIAPILEAVPTMWVFPLFKAFAAVIIGGLGSIEGAILAGMLLGYSETLVSVLISANYPDMVYLVAIILILVLRPRGLMGKRAH